MNKNIFIVFLIIIIISILIYKSVNYFTNSVYNLPKIIWTHWDNMDTAPLIIKNILELRQQKLTDWKINIINDSNIDSYIDKNAYPKNYNTLIPAHKADWIRLFLLNKHGGLWMDSGIIINDASELNKLYNDSILYQSEFTGFYLDSKTINNDHTTFIENWFIMAPMNSRIIKAWFNEFELAIKMGFLNYRHENIKKGVVADQVYLWGETDVYLTMHAALQKILQLKDVPDAKIIIIKAEDTMFKIHSDCNWDNNCIYNKLKNENLKHIPYIKLRGTDRGDGNFTLIN